MMLSPDTIHKAVELAPDVAPWDFYKRNPECIEEMSIVEVDALAAALVRVVDDTEKFMVYEYPKASEVVVTGAIGDEYVTKSEGPDRTENTINAIVEFSESHPEVFK